MIIYLVFCRIHRSIVRVKDEVGEERRRRGRGRAGKEREGKTRIQFRG